MIQTYQRALPHGITLSCRAAGTPGRPLMLFLHGFPEGAFVWDPLLEYFADPAHGGFRCVAPNLRGFEHSSAPAEPEAYRAHLLMQDLLELVALETGDPQGRIHTLVAHDWGGAFAWGLGNAQPSRLDRLVIINSPHPGTFARELRDSPAQQAASAYMNFLARPDAEALLAQDDYRRLWPFFSHGALGAPWLTEAVKDQYRAVWNAGLTGGCNLYRISPLKPQVPGGPAVPELPRERVTVNVPTLVLWALDDVALLPGLVDGLEDFVPRLQLERIAGASHWIVHEQPLEVAARIERFARQ